MADQKDYDEDGLIRHMERSRVNKQTVRDALDMVLKKRGRIKSSETGPIYNALAALDNLIDRADLIEQIEDMKQRYDPIYGRDRRNSIERRNAVLDAVLNLLRGDSDE